MEDSFARSFPATELGARDAVTRVVHELNGIGIAGDKAGEVQIALAEAVNNVVKHAYAGEAAGDMQVELSLAGAMLCVHVRDSGVPFPPGGLPAGEAPKLDVPLDALPEGGFGWLMIRELASSVGYEREDGRNHLKLCFDLGGAAG